MPKLFIAAAAGALLSFLFTQFGLDFLRAPQRLKGNLISAATEAELYSFDADADKQTRALEVYFANRAQDAAALDTAAGHPFLKALQRARAAREARQLAGQWSAYDVALAQPDLRATLEAKHGVKEDEALKRAMLFAALDDKPFLRAWLETNIGEPDAENLRDQLSAAANDSASATIDAAPAEKTD